MRNRRRMKMKSKIALGLLFKPNPVDHHKVTDSLTTELF